ncbi:MAG: phospho-sugar mutase [Saprospiraceae bacterium]|nr:phospho-sugar mutase [Saprospiraceae bacterium]
MEQLSQSIKDQINKWLTEDYDEQTKSDIRKLLADKNDKELSDAFYRDLEFGTGGLRGIMGVGTNRVNKYTIGAATQGLSNYLKQCFPDEKIKVAIAHDNRNNATFLAGITADVFAANGIHVYFFDGLRPTPELSFAIRQLGCKSGVMLTASHNPKEYSGYKAYWDDGGQVVAPHDKNIIQEVNKITSIDLIKFSPDKSLIEKIGPEMDQMFIDVVTACTLRKDVIKAQHDIKIVFSPIHGTGVEIVPRALKAAGFTNINLVEEQCVVDGNFPTVIYPNPEEKEAMSMSVAKAQEIDADLVMATDPDADRVGIAVKNDNHQFELLNGNQTATLLFHYVINAWKEKGLLKGNEYIIKTIVTTYLIDKIAASNGVKCYNVLTGFKFIGDVMTRLDGKETFIAGAEESYGYLVGDHVRDKDAVVACVMISEMCAYYKNAGKSLYQALKEIYVEYGFYKETLISLTKTGQQGAAEINQIMTDYRTNPPQLLGGKKVVKLLDYQLRVETDLLTGQKTPIELPVSNVLQFVTENGFIISARPSGTEPKIKFYISVNTELASLELFAQTEQKLNEIIASISEDLKV